MTARVTAATVPGSLRVADPPEGARSPHNRTPRLLANGSGISAPDSARSRRIEPAPERGSAAMTRPVGSYRLSPARIDPYQSADKVMGTRRRPDRDEVHPSRRPQVNVAVRGFRLYRCITQRPNPVIDEPAGAGRCAGPARAGVRGRRGPVCGIGPPQMTRRPRIRRAMTRRWIWLVPSPISVSFASRM